MDIKVIEDKLLLSFSVAKVNIKDLSGTGDYIQIDIASPDFFGKSTIEQHQMVYKALGDWLKNEIHAVIINTEVLDK